jgi:hypothetical protein
MADALFDNTDNGFSQYCIAQKYGIPQQTISDRLNSQTAMADQIQPYRLLSKNQETKLVFWILHQESLGYALSYSQIRACVEVLLEQQNKKQKIGCNWITKFIRHYPEIKTKPGRHQEAKRFNSFTPKAVYWYFDIREKEYR